MATIRKGNIMNDDERQRYVCRASWIQCPHKDCGNFLTIVNTQRAAAKTNGVRIRIVCEQHGEMNLAIFPHKGQLRIEWE